MPASHVRVVKVGGSLLRWPAVKQRLRDWLAVQPSATCVLIAGGGKVVESIRELDMLHRLGARASHWLCVRAMSVTARLLVDLLEDAALVDELDTLHEMLEARPTRMGVFDAVQFLRSEESSLPGAVLPENWSVTSDSIAARVAQTIDAAELVLLKSSLPESAELSAMAATDYVDEFFPTIAAQLPAVRLVNLRDEVFAEIVLRL